MKKYICIILTMMVAAASTPAQQKDFPKLTGPYLGQKPPGMTPKIFAPGIISIPGITETDINFWPDGKRCIFTRNEILYETKMINNVWTEPELFGPLKDIKCFEPCLTPDGNKIFFGNTELKLPKNVVPEADFALLWFVERTDQGWSKPNFFCSGMFPSIDKTGTVYFTSLSGLEYRESIDGAYHQSTSVFEGPYMEDAHPGIALDGSYLIFDSELRKKINNCSSFITFKLEDGRWSEPKNMGEAVPITLFGARISSDQKYIFFLYDGDIYWVDAKIIEELKPKKR